MVLLQVGEQKMLGAYQGVLVVLSTGQLAAACFKRHKNQLARAVGVVSVLPGQHSLGWQRPVNEGFTEPAKCCPGNAIAMILRFETCKRANN